MFAVEDRHLHLSAPQRKGILYVLFWSSQALRRLPVESEYRAELKFGEGLGYVGTAGAALWFVCPHLRQARLADVAYAHV